MSSAAGTLEHADAWQPAVNPWIIAVAVTLATFMEVLDTSIANVALPHIAGSLSAGQDESTWVLTSYLVSNAIVLPLSGWLSSIVGRKNFYMGCVALFTISSFLCGLAPNLATLIICRVLQGAGGGGLQPSEQAILADTFPPANRGIAFARYVIAAASLTFVIFWEWTHKDPFIDLHLFKDRPFAVSNLLMFMLGFALLGSTLLLPLFSQTLLGYTAEEAGLALMPGGFTIIVLLPLVGFLLSRYSPRWLLVFGLVVLSTSLLHMTVLDLAIHFKTLAIARMLQAAGLAFLFVPINTAAYAFLPREKNNAASGLMNLARNIGGSVGISLVTTMLDRRSQTHLNYLSSHISSSNPAFPSIPQ